MTHPIGSLPPMRLPCARKPRGSCLDFLDRRLRQSRRALRSAAGINPTYEWAKGERAKFRTNDITHKQKLELTWISITNMRVENCVRGTSRASRPMLPGQSHISRGMAVLVLDCSEVEPCVWEGRHALVCMSRDSGSRLQVERLLCRKVVEKVFVNGCLPGSSGHVSIAFAHSVDKPATYLLKPNNNTFVRRILSDGPLV